MSQLADKLENYVLAKLCGKTTTITPPSGMYLGLFRADPGETGLLTSEVTGGSYARLNITSLLSDPSNGYINNATDIVFPQASANWGDITHLGIIDTNTLATGTIYAYISLSATVTINANEQFKINASNFTLQAM